MDPVSVIGVVAAVGQILNGIRAYGSAVKDCKHEVAQLRSELFALKAALEHLDWVDTERSELADPADVKPYRHGAGEQFEDALTTPWSSSVTLIPSIGRTLTPPTDSFAPASGLSQDEGLTHPMLAETVETQQALHDAARVVSDLSKALSTDGRNRAGRLVTKLLWPLKREQVLGYAKHLERLKTYFILVTTTDNVRLTNDVYKEVVSLGNVVQQNENHRANKELEDLRRQSREWLSPCDAKEFQKAALKERLQGTGSWFLNHQMDHWTISPDTTRLLWLRGPSGCGKTTLVSSCIERLQSFQETVPLAFFYCSVGVRASGNPINVFGSLLEQLCDFYPQWWPSVEAMYSKATNSGRRSAQRAEISDLIDLTKRIAKTQKSSVYLILDAANESHDCNEMLRLLFSLLENESVRVLVSSTEDLYLPAVLSENVAPVVVDMTLSYVQEDIVAYVDACLHDQERLRLLPLRIREDIKQEIVNRSDGSFRWAQCQIDSFAHARSAKQIRQSLLNVPRTLEETYFNILNSIEDDDRPLVRRMLVWLTAGLRALRVAELAEAAVFTADMEDFDADDRLLDPMQLIRSCKSLVRYNSEIGYCTLAHSSVRDYLSSQSLRKSTLAYYYMDETQIETDVTSVCIKYLSLPAFASGHCSAIDARKRREGWPLLSYACEYWTTHTRILSGSSSSGKLAAPIIDMLFEFFGTEELERPRGGNFAAWYQQAFREGSPVVWESRPLYTAARSGLLSVIQAILASEGTRYLETPGGRLHSTPLHVAAACGHCAAAELLLKAGADPNERNGEGENGMQWARFYKDDDMVALLLDHGADPNLLTPERMNRRYPHSSLQAVRSLYPWITVRT
ncbi:MAG: hypothetical protein M1828_003196 [Chrysothrix sp. TS-e1954]|nr:MAG: hypothetical protein M1828_003196 [Chrysothrix sp. TS-e1954]